MILMAPLASVARATDESTSPPRPPILHLAGGGSTAGEIRPSTRPGVLRWQSASSGSPADFACNEVVAVEWPPPAIRPKTPGDYRFELAAGDVLFGSLLALDNTLAELEVPRLGRIRVQRSHLHRIDRWRDGADLIDLGPNGLVGWREPAGRKDWRVDSGRPMTDREGASIRRNLGLPARASIEFEISWKSRPDFVLALGVGEGEDTVKRAFRFEVWSADMIVQRELEREADLEIVYQVSPGFGRVHLLAYLDQEKGRILVFTPRGQQVADLKVRGARPAVLPGLYLGNLRGDVRLEWLRIARWDGEVPGQVRPDRARIRRADGSIRDGHLTGMAAATREFLLKTEEGEMRIPEDQVSSVVLPVPEEAPPRMIRAIYQDGARVSGELVMVEDSVLALTVPGIQESLRLPLAGLRCLVAPRHETPGRGRHRGKGS
jgi:hypothetical protein